MDSTIKTVEEAMLSSLKEDYEHSITDDGESCSEDYNVKQYLVFVIGGSRFGIETASCRQVLRVPQIVSLPEIPPHILGIINLRGRVVSVTSLAVLMGLNKQEITSSSRLVVIFHSGTSTAILADSVENIVEYGENIFKDVGAKTTGSEFAVFEVFQNNELLLLLSPEKIFQDDNMNVDVRGL